MNTIHIDACDCSCIDYEPYYEITLTIEGESTSDWCEGNEYLEDVLIGMVRFAHKLSELTGYKITGDIRLPDIGDVIEELNDKYNCSLNYTDTWSNEDD